MIISLISALSENSVIGKGYEIPWHIPEDLKYFKKKTLNSIIIMGRKTFESIGSKPLPKRLNIVVSRNLPEQEGVIVCPSIESALEKAKENLKDWNEEVFICGGERIYAAALPYADKLYLTRVHAEIDGDVFFPQFDEREYKEIFSEYHTGELPYTFQILEKN